MASTGVIIMKLIKILTSLYAATILSGCTSFTIGEEEFSCAGKPDHSLCKGPMEIYELTNNHDDLEHMMTDEYRQQVMSEKEHNHKHQDIAQPQLNKDEDLTYVYESRSLRRQNNENYDKANIVAIASNQSMTQSSSNDELDNLRTFNYVPNDIAPEPLAVLEEAEAMRIYVSSWEDKGGDWNIPGYVYVELKPRRWISGHQAEMRPSRVLPFQVIQKSKTNSNRKSNMARGVDPLSIARPMQNQNGL